MPYITSLTRRAAVLAATALLALGATAQTWPERPVKLVVPFPAGGGADVAARTFAEKLGVLLGQTVFIDNKPGASGNIGAELVARGPADGYTLLFGNESLATNPLMFKNLRYDTRKDFVPIAKVASTPVAIATHPAVPAKTIQELVALARTKTLNYASPGVGTGPDLFGRLIALSTGAQFNSIPYKGSAPATADAVGGQVDFIISTLTPMIPHFQVGRLRPVAVTGAKRSVQAPEVPTLIESGFSVQAYSAWYGVVAPVATPKPVLDRLVQASMRVMQDPEVVAKLRNAGYEVDPTFGDVFGREIRVDMERWQRVIEEAKVTRD